LRKKDTIKFGCVRKKDITLCVINTEMMETGKGDEYKFVKLKEIE